MKNKSSIISLAAVYLVISQLNALAAPLNIIPDTLDVTTKSITIEDSVVFVKNNSTDTTFVDSIAVSEFKTKSKQVQLQLGVRTGKALRTYTAQYYATRGWSTLTFSGFRILANETAFVDQTNIEICFICPTGKTTAARGVGDSVFVKLTLYSGNNKDTLTMIGVQKIASSVKKIESKGNGFIGISKSYNSKGKDVQRKANFPKTPIFGRKE